MSLERVEDVKQDGSGVRAVAARATRNLAALDVLVTVYLLVLWAAVYQGAGPDRETCLRLVEYDLAAFLVGVALIRTSDGGPLTALAARALAPAVVVISYFQLRLILPVVSSAAYDAQLYALDMAWFGYEPAIAWDRFVTPATTEWFSFFYFGYYFVLLGYVLSMTLLCKDLTRLSKFAFGIILVFTATHLLYMVVPAYGPYKAMPEAFTRPLEGGLWWHLVQASVATEGALKDVFPSLHTGAPVFMTAFAFRHRAIRPYRIALVPLFLVTSQIVIATMFLRWHYVIDIFAGIAVALAADQIAERVTRWETERRARIGATPVMPKLWR